MYYIDIHTTVVWYIALVWYLRQYRMTVFNTVLHVVDMFVWDCSFFNQYSYYRDFFCSWPASRLHDRNCHMWVRYIDTTIFTFWRISSILIHMTYFSVYTICISENYKAIASYSPKPIQQVSAILWNITITNWLQSQVHCVTYYFVLTHEIFTSQNKGTHYTVII